MGTEKKQATRRSPNRHERRAILSRGRADAASEDDRLRLGGKRRLRVMRPRVVILPERGEPLAAFVGGAGLPYAHAVGTPRPTTDPATIDLAVLR